MKMATAATLRQRRRRRPMATTATIGAQTFFFIAFLIACVSSFSLRPRNAANLLCRNRHDRPAADLPRTSLTMKSYFGENDNYLDTLTPTLTTEVSSSDIPPTSSSSKRKRKTRSKQPEQKNLYAILGADPFMTKPEIKRLYLTLAKQTHPDSVGYSPENIDRFNEVARAWSILSDNKSRKRYDRELKAEEIKQEFDEYMSEKGREIAPKVGKWYDDILIPWLTNLATVYFKVEMVAEDVGVVVRVLGGLFLIHLVQNFLASGFLEAK